MNSGRFKHIAHYNMMMGIEEAQVEVVEESPVEVEEEEGAAA